MELGQCLVLYEKNKASSFGFMTIHRPKQNNYVSKNFFEDKNYQLIIDCLDEGYAQADALLISMKHYVSIRRNEVAQLEKYSEISASRLKALSPLSFHGTTSRVQLATFESFKKQADILLKSCVAIEGVIKDYATKINEMYPKRRFHTSRKHCQSDQIKDEFRKAREPLKLVLADLETLLEIKKKSHDNSEGGSVGSENGNRNPTKDNKQKAVADIQEQIRTTEELRDARKENYINEAKKIFEKCRKLEKKRLDQMNEALNAFIQKIHLSCYSDEICKNFDKILSDIKTKLDTAEDVNKFAQTYCVDMPPLNAVPVINENPATEVNSEPVENAQTQAVTTSTV